MYAFSLIGMTEQGKSRKARELITTRGMQMYGALVNDVNNEYGATRRDRETGEERPSVNLPVISSAGEANAYPRSRFVTNAGDSMKEYLKIVREKRNTTVIFEECTAFFKGRTPPGLCEMIINKGHTYNNYIFMWHSIRSVPPELLGLMDWVILFKTGDNEAIVKQKDVKLLPYWLVLQSKQKGTQPFIIDWQREQFDEGNYKRMREIYLKSKMR